MARWKQPKAPRSPKPAAQNPVLNEMMLGWAHGTPEQKRQLVGGVRPSIRDIATHFGATTEAEIRTTLEVLEAACRAELNARG